MATASAQTDSLSARYLKFAVERIEGRLPAHMVVKSDTVIADEKGNINVHVNFYLDRGSGEIEKIIEETNYQGVKTEIVVYYRAGSPILFCTKQWEGSALKIDFEYVADFNFRH